MRKQESAVTADCLIDMYISRLPSEAKSKDLFYARQLENATKDDSIWYCSAPIGRNKWHQTCAS